MNRIILIMTICFSLVTAGGLVFAGDSAEETNLKKIADDMKFGNAMEFYKLEKYNRALNEFYEYIEIYYDGIHRNEAFRKIAEIHIKNFNYKKAIEAYNHLYQEFSGTDEGLDAYFQTAVCYKKMGFDNKAEEIFKYIIENHRGTTAAYNSEIQIELLKMENE